MGPSIGDLGLRLGGGDGWLTQHDIVYTSAGCSQDTTSAVLLCGSLPSGATMTITVIATPKAPGGYSYGASFCDCSNGRNITLFGPGAPRFLLPGASPPIYAQSWTETVLQEPSAMITVHDVYGAALSGVEVQVLGSSQTANTGPAGVADLGLGPLGPGTYTVAAAMPGYMTTTAEISVPAFGDATAAAIVMPAAATHVQAGSDPSVLPGALLVADEDNNRLLILSPSGQVMWEFPRPGDLAAGETFLRPDDAFFSPDGTQIIATQEEDFAVSLIDVATHRIVWRYGQPGVHGSGPNQLWNPDDAMVMPNGDVVISDIVNCRIIVVAAGQHVVAHSYGRIGTCHHEPPVLFGSPNGAFPMSDGNWLVTEINGDWVTEMAPGGKVLWSTHPPGVAYPSDTNEIGPDRYLTVDYSLPGQIVIFNSAGQTLWRYRPTGAEMLDHPSLALGLPNGDVALNDDYNDRVIVVDPRTNRVVWQYGTTGRPGSALGQLANPDGIDLALPDSLLGTHSGTLVAP